MKRLERLRAAMVEREIPALLVTDEVNVRYLSGFTGDSTYLLVTDSDAILLSDRRYEEQLQIECGQWKAAIRGPEKLMPMLVGEVVGDLGIRQLGVEDHAISLSVYRTLEKKLKPCELVATSGVIGGLRAIKDASEVETIRQAIHCAERAFGVLRASITATMTELEASYLLEAAIRDFGGQGVGFASIIAAGPAGALPHYHPGKGMIGNDRGLLVDWGAKFDGYTSDMTRVLAIGAPPKKLFEIYQIVLDAHLAAVAAIRPGVPLKEVDEAARNVIVAAGYGDKFGHGLGHGIGLEVHESPRMASIAEGCLQSGMVVTVEPGIYLPGEFGVRIEDDVLVTDMGHEVLCGLPKGLEENVVIL